MFWRKQTKGLPSYYQEEDVSISCFTWSPNMVRDLLDECRHHYLGLVQNKTSVLEYQGEKWKPSKPKDKRHMSTVILDESVKDKLVDDISDFLDPATRRWYSKCGIPYQRGYLLYGPPGTGKSSLSLSIAGKFDLDVYILNLSSTNDKDLKALFAGLPRHCVVLLEDVDAVSLKRSTDTGTNPDQNGLRPSSKTDGGKVSLSTLLNILDGVGSPEGHVLIMTTNHIERLDEALIRPGCTDEKFEFQLADEKMMVQLFHFVFLEGDDPEPGKTVEDSSEAKCGESSKPGPGKSVEDGEKIELLATEFAAKVPKYEFSPAEIMSLLLVNKQSPRQAVDNVKVWMKKIREEKKKVKRADSWVLNE